MTDLILRLSGRKPPHEWTLQLRQHGPAETDYHTIAHVSDAVARDIMQAGACSWLFGDPDGDGVQPWRGEGAPG